MHNDVQIKEIPAEKFEFVNSNDIWHDKAPQTKPVGFWRDAIRRFAKNKGSVVAFFVLIVLTLFGIIASLSSPYQVSDRFTAYNFVLPKISADFDMGFWNGTQKVTLDASEYYKLKGIGVEGARSGVRENKPVEFDDTYNLYTFTKDSYAAVGYKIITVTMEQYQAIQSYQDENNIQVIYPMIVLNEMYSSNDYNYWYKTDNRGMPVFDDNGNYIPIYVKFRYADAYTSKMRIAGDPGIEDPNSQDRYVYAVASGSKDASIRVDYYEYFKFMNGHYPCFLFGVNESGQDLMTCVAVGLLLSLMLGVCVALINFIIGAVYGAIEGYYGGVADLIMERISDILAGVPFIVLATLFQLHLAQKWDVIPSLLFAFVLTGWIGTASTVRMQFYRYKGHEYVLAARTLGAKDGRLIFKHIFPNALGTIVTSAALAIPSVIFTESSLSYLGIVTLNKGNLISLGTLLSNGQGVMTQAPHIVLFPAIVISLLMICFNLFGNGLRDAFNPSLRGAEG